MRHDIPQPLPDATLELVLDGEVIECDVYEISSTVVPDDEAFRMRDVTQPHVFREMFAKISYRVVARRKRGL